MRAAPQMNSTWVEHGEAPDNIRGVLDVVAGAGGVIGTDVVGLGLVVLAVQASPHGGPLYGQADADRGAEGPCGQQRAAGSQDAAGDRVLGRGIAVAEDLVRQLVTDDQGKLVVGLHEAKQAGRDLDLGAVGERNDALGAAQAEAVVAGLLGTHGHGDRLVAALDREGDGAVRGRGAEGIHHLGLATRTRPNVDAADIEDAIADADAAAVGGAAGDDVKDPRLVVDVVGADRIAEHLAGRRTLRVGKPTGIGGHHAGVERPGLGAVRRIGPGDVGEHGARLDEVVAIVGEEDLVLLLDLCDRQLGVYLRQELRPPRTRRQKNAR